jgi:hypothetical protein
MNRLIGAIILSASFLICGIAAAEDGFVYNDHNLRDPFWPLVSQGGAIVNYDTNFVVSEMTLEGVVSDGAGGVAIINGNIVEQGKKIGLYTVQEIRKDRVILMKDGKTSVLQIKKEE